MPTTTLPGPVGPLHIDDHGAGGPPLVFLHAFAGNGEHWRAQLDHFRKSHRAIALDFRNHGRSGATDLLSDLTVDWLADDVAAVVNRLGLYDFVLIGHSMGGAVAIDYAAGHPDRVAGLLTIGAPGKLPDNDATRILASLMADYDGVTAAYWQTLLAGARPETVARVRAGMKKMAKDPGFALIKALFDFDPVPGMILYPGPKLAVVPGEAELPHDLHRIVPGLPFARIFGTSHWAHIDAPGEINAIIEAFIETQVQADLDRRYARAAE